MRTKNMHVKDNQLYMGKFSLEELAKKYKTPLYVYDEVGLREKMDIFKNYFKSDNFECYVVYATKAFLAPRLCKMLNEYGFYADGVSSGDMYLMEKSGFPMEHIVLHGNNKSFWVIESPISSISTFGSLSITIETVTSAVSKPFPLSYAVTVSF